MMLVHHDHETRRAESRLVYISKSYERLEPREEVDYVSP